MRGRGAWRAGATSPAAATVEPGTRPAAGAVRLSEVVSALSYALDITEGQSMGHAVRTTMIGMRIGRILGLSDEQRSALFYGLLLKDLGCSSNAARLTSLFGADDRLLKHAHKLTDWSASTQSARYAFKYSMPGRSRAAKAWHALMMGVREKGSGREMMQTRCERGADIARMLGLPKGAAEAIRGLDEHWDGNGMPYGMRGSATPILGRIASLAQTVEVFANAFDVRTAYEMAHARRGRWFDPVLVDCLDAFQLDAGFWANLREADTLTAVRALEPADHVVHVDEERLDVVAQAFAHVIDAKSPFTATHSQNVAAIAVAAGDELGIEGSDRRMLKRAALLHDIGKLVSNQHLDRRRARRGREETCDSHPLHAETKRVTRSSVRRPRRRIMRAQRCRLPHRAEGGGAGPGGARAGGSGRDRGPLGGPALSCRDEPRPDLRDPPASGGRGPPLSARRGSRRAHVRGRARRHGSRGGGGRVAAKRIAPRSGTG